MHLSSRKVARTAAACGLSLLLAWPFPTAPVFAADAGTPDAQSEAQASGEGAGAKAESQPQQDAATPDDQGAANPTANTGTIGQNGQETPGAEDEARQKDESDSQPAASPESQASDASSPVTTPAEATPQEASPEKDQQAQSQDVPYKVTMSTSASWSGRQIGPVDQGNSSTQVQITVTGNYTGTVKVWASATQPLRLQGGNGNDMLTAHAKSSEGSPVEFSSADGSANGGKGTTKTDTIWLEGTAELGSYSGGSVFYTVTYDPNPAS